MPSSARTPDDPAARSPRPSAPTGASADLLGSAGGREPASGTTARRRGTRPINVFQLLGLMGAFAGLAAIGGLLAGGLVAPLALASSSLTHGATQVFDDLPTELKPDELSQASYIYGNDGKTLLATYYWENRIVVPLKKISPIMQHAVIATEDKRFYEHGAVDLVGIPRAFVNNLMGKDTQGASTLTQQYVKNVLIEKAHAAGDAEGVAEATASTYERKLREAKLAIALEQQMSKDEILQGYLNIAQFGTSVYGVEAAARHYFSTTAKKLTPVQAATIAGITQRPSAYDPLVHPEASEKRRNIVLSLMYQQGYITKAEYEKARETPIKDTLKIKPVRQGCVAAKSAAFFCDYVTKVITSDPVFGKTTQDRQELLYRGGLRIVTTIDMKAQKEATKIMRQSIPVDEPHGIADAMSTVEPGTGKIVVMAQNRKYDPSPEPAKNKTSVNYNTDQAHGGSRGFQPGSTFKTFTLTEWLKEGHTLNESINASRHAWVANTFNAPCTTLGTDVWNPQNSEGAASGNITVLHATAESVNTGYSAMEHQLNLCSLADTAYDVGFRPSESGDDDVWVVPSMTLGVQNTSPLAQAAAYATYASGGTYCDPIAIVSVTDSTGKKLDVPSANCRRVIPEDIANTVTYALEHVLVPGGSAPGNTLADGRQAAGKTGTAGNSTHLWFVGYTPQLSTAVWVGNPETNLVMRHITINGTYYPYGVYGASIAAPAWKSFMDYALAGEPKETFPDPDWSMVGHVTTSDSGDDSDDDDKGSDDSGSKEDKGSSDKGSSDHGSSGKGSSGSHGGGSSHGGDHGHGHGDD